MQTSIFRIEAAFAGRVELLRAQLGLPPEAPPKPDKAAVGRQLKQTLRAIGAHKRGGKSGQ